jgi:hypothetical protein
MAAKEDKVRYRRALRLAEIVNTVVGSDDESVAIFALLTNMKDRMDRFDPECREVLRRVVYVMLNGAPVKPRKSKPRKSKPRLKLKIIQGGKS